MLGCIAMASNNQYFLHFMGANQRSLLIDVSAAAVAEGVALALGPKAHFRVVAGGGKAVEDLL